MYISDGAIAYSFVLELLPFTTQGLLKAFEASAVFNIYYKYGRKKVVKHLNWTG